MKEWVSDAHMVFERNPNYWRKDSQGRDFPYLQTIRYEVIPDAAVRVAALETGQVELSTIPAVDVPRVKADPRIQTANFVGSGTTKWYINHAFPPLDNIWFRRALASAMDRQTYIRNFLTGDEPLATGLLTPASWGHDPEIKNYTYDVGKVREYLQRSGLPQSQWRIRAQPFGATINEAEQFFEESVRQAGITIEWAQPERDGWRTRVIKGLGGDGSAGMYFSGWSLRVDPDGNVGQFYVQNAAYNSGQAPVPEVEPLVVKARETYDLSERKKLYSEIQEKAVENVYSHILHHYSIAQIFAVRRVGNLENYYGGEGKPRYANLWV
jgi:ABC-type transport system substrate-binding protein